MISTRLYSDRTESESASSMLISIAIALILILTLHFIYLISHDAPAIATPDANGYWAQGARIAISGKAWFEPESDVQYIGTHWLVTDSGRYFSRYPPGLAVLIAAAYKTLGYEASVWLNLVLATITLLGSFFLARSLIGGGWALIVVLILAMTPAFNQQAWWRFAHMAVACYLVWGVFFLIRWSRDGRLWEAFLAGAALGAIPTIRYPEALFGLGVCVFILWSAREQKRSWVHVVAACAGAALPIGALMIRNQLAFGAVYRTAYALTNEQTGFGWGYFVSHFAPYIRGLHSDGLGIFFPLGVMGMAAMCRRLEWRRVGVLLVLLVVPTLLLYMAYYWSPRGMGGRQSGDMRFLVPTLIFYIIAGVWFLSYLTQNLPARARIGAVGGLLFLQLAWTGFLSSDRNDQLLHQKRCLVRITDALNNEIERGDVVIAQDKIQQHLDFVARWRLADMRSLRPMPRGRFQEDVRQEEDQDRPSPRQAEKEIQRREKYADMPPMRQERVMAEDLRRWARDSGVYYVGTEDELKQMRGRWFSKAAFDIIARIPLPESPQLAERERPAGGPRDRRSNRQSARANRFDRAEGDGPMGRAAPGMMSGGGRQDAGPGGGPAGGPGGPGGGFGDATEIVIARWNFKPEGYPVSFPQGSEAPALNRARPRNRRNFR